ncbi:MAG: hypothetical protein WC447_00090 [Candidatus Paceibacterota bacterium]
MSIKKIVIAIIIIAIIVVGILVWSKKDSTTVPEPVTPQTNSQTETGKPVAEEKTPVEKYFDGIKAVEPNTEKGKTVQAILLPILQKIYNKEVDSKVIEGVKLQEQFGSMFTYVCNRVVVESDMTTVKTELEKEGFKTAEISGKSMTMMKIGQSWVLTFWLNNQQKAGLEVTF